MNDVTRLRGIAQDKSVTLLAMHRLLVAHLPPVMHLHLPGAAFAPCETRLIARPVGTVFVWCSMATETGYPFRQFDRVLANKGVNLVFFKDFEQIWYQRGLLGATTDRHSTAAFLTAQFGHLPRPWTFVGGSAGGHAAIHFGIRLQADHVVAFSPQTFITPATWQTFRLGTAAPAQFDFDDPTNDLQPLVAQLRQGGTQVHLHVGCGNERDMAHARRLSGGVGLRLIKHPSDSHLIAGLLRDQGQLADAILAPDRATAAQPGH